jgi:hypothetical protein
MKLDMTKADYRRLTGRPYDLPLDVLEEAWKKKGGGGGYKKPAGWVKPDVYPGLHGPDYHKDMGKGILNLGLVDPDAFQPGSPKLATSIYRNIVRILIKLKGEAYISDPEWVLKKVYPTGLLKDQLAGDVESALADLFGQEVQVSMKGSTVKGGFGWKITAKGLGDLIKEDIDRWLESFEEMCG